MKITSLVQNTIAICCCVLVFIIAFIWIAFHFNDSTNAFKDSLNISASFFSGIATLAAAYIASKLFNDWRDQHNKQIDNTIALNALERFTTFEESFQRMVSSIEDLRCVNQNIRLDEIKKYNESNYKYNKLLADKDLVEVNFTLMISSFKNYGKSIDSDQKISLTCDEISHKFYDIHQNQFKDNFLNEFMNTLDTRYIGYLDLIKLTNNKIINDLIQNLKES